MTVLGLTDYAQIRGVLTVSPADLPDEALEAYGLEDDLTVDLGEWLPGWEQVLGDGGHQATLLKLYAKYRCAYWVSASAQNFVLTQFTDGANAGQRSDTEGFGKIRDHMAARAADYRTKLELAIDPSATAEVRPLLGVSSPLRDPVTEGRS